MSSGLSTPTAASRRSSRLSMRDETPAPESIIKIEDDASADDEAIAPKKPTASTKSSKSKALDIKASTKKKAGAKRKSSDEDDETDAEKTLVELDDSDASAKKRKSVPRVDTEPSKFKPRGRPKKTATTTAAASKTREKTTSTKSTQVSTAPAPAPAPVEIDYALINTQMNQSIQAALLPCLDLIQPLMNYTLACAGLKGEQTEEANVAATSVVDAVEKVKKEWQDLLLTPVDDEGFEFATGL